MSFKDTFYYDYMAKERIPYVTLSKLIDKAIKLAHDYHVKNPNLDKKMIMNRALIIVYNDNRADNIHKDMIKFYNENFKDNERD